MSNLTEFSDKHERHLKNVQLSTYRSNLLKEIDLIQSIINRMANNSFLIKGWTVSLITLIVAFKINEPHMLLLVIFPVLVFWILDGFFLQQGRLYRSLYNWVINNRMTDETNTFSLDTQRFRNKENSLLRAMWSITLLSFYGGTLFLVLVVTLCKLFCIG